jgi:hypothetical protein
MSRPVSRLAIRSIHTSRTQLAASAAATAAAPAARKVVAIPRSSSWASSAKISSTPPAAAVGSSTSATATKQVTSQSTPPPPPPPSSPFDDIDLNSIAGYGGPSKTASPSASTSPSSADIDPSAFVTVSPPLRHFPNDAYRPLPTAGQEEGVDWSTSFAGMSETPFPEKAEKVLMKALDPDDIEIKPGMSLAA